MFNRDFLGKKFWRVAPRSTGSTQALPPPPLCGILLAGMLIVTMLWRPSQCRNWVPGNGFSHPKMFHGCNILKIKKLAVKIHCSTQHNLTLRKDTKHPAYLQAFQRVCMRFLLFLLSGCLCGVCGFCVCVLCRSKFSHTGLRVLSVKIFHICLQSFRLVF